MNVTEIFEQDFQEKYPAPAPVVFPFGIYYDTTGNLAEIILADCKKSAEKYAEKFHLRMKVDHIRWDIFYPEWKKLPEIVFVEEFSTELIFVPRGKGYTKAPVWL